MLAPATIQITADDIERGAIAIYRDFVSYMGQADVSGFHLERRWNSVPKLMKDQWRSQSRACITAFLAGDEA